MFSLLEPKWSLRDKKPDFQGLIWSNFYSTSSYFVHFLCKDLKSTHRDVNLKRETPLLSTLHKICKMTGGLVEIKENRKILWNVQVFVLWSLCQNLCIFQGFPRRITSFQGLLGGEVKFQEFPRVKLKFQEWGPNFRSFPGVCRDPVRTCYSNYSFNQMLKK